MPSADPGADVRVQPSPLLNGTDTPTPAGEVRNQIAPIVYNGDVAAPAANAQILLADGWRAGDSLDFNVAYGTFMGFQSDNCFDLSQSIGFNSVPTVESSIAYETIPWAQNNNDSDPDGWNGDDGALPGEGVVPEFVVSLSSSSPACAVLGIQDIVTIAFTNQSSDLGEWFELTVSDIAYDVGATVPTGPVRNGVFATSGQGVVTNGVRTEATAYGYNSKDDAYSMTQWTNTAFVSGYRFLSSGIGATTVDASQQFITTITLDELRADGILAGNYTFRFGQFDPTTGQVNPFPATVDNLEVVNPDAQITGQSFNGNGDNTLTVTVNPATGLADLVMNVHGRVVFPGLITVELIGWPGQETDGAYYPDDQQIDGVYAAPGGQGVNWSIGGTPHASTGVPSFGAVLEHPSGFPIVWSGFGAYVEHVDPMESFVSCVREVIVTPGAEIFETEYLYVLIDGDLFPLGTNNQPLDEPDTDYDNTQPVSPTNPQYVGEFGPTHQTAQVPTGDFNLDDVEFVYGYGPLNGNAELEPCVFFFLDADADPELDSYSGYIYDYDEVLFEYVEDLPMGTEADIVGEDFDGDITFGIVTDDATPYVRNCGMYTVDLLPQQNVYTIDADGYTDASRGISCFSDVNPPQFPPVAVAYSNALPDRIGGANRYETANNIGMNVSPCANTAVLVNGHAYPDALSASYLAGALREIFMISSWLAGDELTYAMVTPDVPILTTNGNSLSQAARVAITEMGVQRVYIVGGTAAVSQAVEDTLASQTRTDCGGNSYLPFAQPLDVRRVEGANRYDTNAAVVNRVQSIFADAGPFGWARYNDRIREQLNFGNPSLRTAIVATGEAFPDALSAGPLSYTNFPLVLTSSTSLSAQALFTLDSIGIEQVIVMGGTAAISQDVVDSIVANTLVGADDVIRIGGEDRYETNVDFLDFLRTVGSYDPDPDTAEGVDYTWGMNWPDCFNQFGPYPWWDFFGDNAGSDSFLYGWWFRGMPSNGILTAEHDYYELLFGDGDFAETFSSSVFLARGDDFADALASAPLVGASCAALLLTTPQTLHPTAAEWLTANSEFTLAMTGETWPIGITNVIALGLAQAVGNTTLAQANAALFPPIGPS